MSRKVLRVRKFRKAGYVLITERISGEEAGGGKSFPMTSAYTLKGEERGDYIGTSTWAYRLAARGIKPEKASPDHSVCSIGFCYAAEKWYGWSHRAIYGFGIGDTVAEGDCCASSGYTEEYLAEYPEKNKSLPVGFTAKSMVDCRTMAIAFAASVS